MALELYNNPYVCLFAGRVSQEVTEPSLLQLFEFIVLCRAVFFPVCSHCLLYCLLFHM